jgi:long-subunit fatty acid transport protein
MRTRRLVIAMVALLLPGGTAPAPGSPLETSSGNAVFSGVTNPHPSSLFYNPAAMGLVRPGQHWFLGADLRIDSFRIARQTYDLTAQTFSPGPTVAAATFSPGGMAAFYSSVADQGVFGLAIHTPVWEEFIANRPALGYHVLGGRIWQTLLTLAGTYKASSRIHFGLGLSVGFTRFQLDLARDTALEAGSNPNRGVQSSCGPGPCGLENPAATQVYRINVGTQGLTGLFAAKNLSLSLGLAIRPVGDWWFALSYVSPPGAITDLDVQGIVGLSAAPRDGGQQVNGDAEITFQMPPSVHFGVRGPILPGYDLVGGLRWQNFSRQNLLDIRFYGTEVEQSQDVPEWYPRQRGLNDVYRLELGLEAEDEAALRLGARIHYETSATSPGYTTPLQVYGGSVGLAAGVEARITQSLVVAAGYDLSWFPAVNSNPSAFDPRDRIGCVDSGYAFDPCAAARDGRATPTAAGEYNRLQQAMTLYLRYDRL